MGKDWDMKKLKAHALAMAIPTTRVEIYEKAIKKHERQIKRLKWLIKIAKKQIASV
jgi:hypothetical protein